MESVPNEHPDPPSDMFTVMTLEASKNHQWRVRWALVKAAGGAIAWVDGWNDESETGSLSKLWDFWEENTGNGQSTNVSMFSANAAGVSAAVADRDEHLDAGNPPFPVVEISWSPFGSKQQENEPEDPWTPFDPSTPADTNPMRCTNEVLVHLGWRGTWDWDVRWALERTPEGNIDWVEPWTGDGKEIAPAEYVWDYWQSRGQRSKSHRQAMLRVRPGSAQAAVAYLDSLLGGEHNAYEMHGLPVPPLLPGEAPLSDDDPVGAFEEDGFNAPIRFRRVLAWQLAAQLVRRHPADMWVVQRLPMDGFYDCVTVVDNRSFGNHWQVLLNQHGTSLLMEPMGDMWRWPLLWESGHDGREFLRRVEQRLGFAPPTRPLPPSTPASLAVRWIAQFLTMQVGSRRHWRAAGGIHLEGADRFVGLPEIGEQQRDSYWTVGYGTPYSDDWQPRAVLSVGGQLWIRDTPVKSLTKLHRSGDPISGLVVGTAGALLP